MNRRQKQVSEGSDSDYLTEKQPSEDSYEPEIPWVDSDDEFTIK